MARCIDVLVAAAAIAAAISMQGCGLPDAIKIPCRDALTGPLQTTYMEAMQTAETQCLKTFHAPRPQSQCIASSAGFVKRAQDSALDGFIDKCGEYARKHVCTKKDCTDITPSTLHNVIQTWVRNQFQGLVQQMMQSVNSHLKSDIENDYMTKFVSRRIPRVVEEQCRSYTLSRLTGNEMLAAQTRISEICYQRIPPNPANRQAYLQCQSQGVVKLGNVRTKQVQSFTERCARNTLNRACPIGSQCAIDTGLLPLWETDNFAQAYLSSNFQAFLSSLQSDYMDAANSFVPNWGPIPPFKKLFELPDNLIPQSTFTMGAGLFAAIVMVTMGGVALVVRMRRRQQRDVLSRPESSELLSVEEQGKNEVVE